jgi:hypothetical protein
MKRSPSSKFAEAADNHKRQATHSGKERLSKSKPFPEDKQAGEPQLPDTEPFPEDKQAGEPQLPDTEPVQEKDELPDTEPFPEDEQDDEPELQDTEPLTDIVDVSIEPTQTEDEQDDEPELPDTEPLTDIVDASIKPTQTEASHTPYKWLTKKFPQQGKEQFNPNFGIDRANAVLGDEFLNLFYIPGSEKYSQAERELQDKSVFPKKTLQFQRIEQDTL